MIQIIGYIAAVLTSSSFIPQAIKTIKTQNTKGISLLMYMLFSIGVLLWFIYGILEKDYPILIANAVTFTFAVIVLIFKIKNVIKGESI